jgi:hypothetical protein
VQSVAEQIAAKVRTRLTAISTVNGYETTASQVIRPKRIETLEPRSYTIIIKQGDLTPNAGISCAGNPPAIGWNFPFEIVGIIRQSEKDITSQDTYKNQFHADVVKAICSPTDWHNWDGLAVNSMIGGVDDFQSGEGEDSAFIVQLTVMFRHDENDPYSVR